MGCVRSGTASTNLGAGGICHRDKLATEGESVDLMVGKIPQKERKRGERYEQRRRAFGWDRSVGIWEHGGDHVVVGRESFDSLDDCSWDFQLVLCDLLRRGEVRGKLTVDRKGKRDLPQRHRIFRRLESSGDEWPV